MKQGKLNPNELLKSISMETSQKVSIVHHDKIAVEKQKSSQNQNKNKSQEQRRSPNISVTQKKENKSKPQSQPKKTQ